MSLSLLDMAWETEVGSHTEKLILVALADHSNDQGACWPSISRLARRCHLARSSVFDAIKGLKSRGIIEVKVTPGRGSTYTLNRSAMRTGPGGGPVRQPDPTSPPRGPHPSGRRTGPVRQPDPNRNEPPKNHHEPSARVPVSPRRTAKIAHRL